MKSGSNVGIAVFDHKEPILKAINCNCMFNNFFLNHSHYFWDRPRIYEAFCGEKRYDCPIYRMHGA